MNMKYVTEYIIEVMLGSHYKYVLQHLPKPKLSPSSLVSSPVLSHQQRLGEISWS